MAGDRKPLVLAAAGLGQTRSGGGRLKAAEQALRESEARSQSLFEANPHPMWMYDVATLAFLEVNDAAVAHYGYRRDEFLALTIADIHLPAELPRLLAHVARIAGLPCEPGTWRHRTKDGSTITAEITCHAFDHKGRPSRLVLAHDISDRTRTEESRRNREAELREAELREAQRIAGIGSWEWSPATGAVTWSEGLNRIMARGFDLPPLTFETVEAFYTPESWTRLGTAIARTIETGAPYELELEMVRVDGTTCWTTTRGEALCGPEGAVVMLRGTVHDIDERKRAEESRQHREAQLREAQRIAAMGSWEWTIATGAITWSEGMNRILARELDRPAPTFETLEKVYTPESWERLRVVVTRAVETGAPYELELEMFRTDGKTCWIMTNGEALRGPDGTVVMLRGTVHNIDERKRAEAIRRNREAELREAQRIAGIGSWEWTPATGIVNWSEGMNRLLARGLDLPAPTFGTLGTFYTRESWEQLGAAIARTIETGAPYELELEMIRANLTTCWTTTRGEALRGPEGAVVMLRGTVHDIDERKRAEGQLHLQSAALNAAAHSMLITDRDGIIAWINPAYTALTGYSAAEAVGRNPRDLVKSGAHDRRFYEELWTTILAGQVWHGELTNRRKNGSRYSEDQTITPVKDAQGRITHFIAIQRDLTDQRELEAQLLQSQKMEAIGTLAGGIAHDFNNILGAILGYTELATANAVGNDVLLNDLQEVTAAGQRATDLVRQILTFSRREAPVRQQIRLDSVVREALKLLRASLPASIEFRSSLDPATPPVLADPTQVHQIIMNLGTNAWHAMKDRPGVLEVTLGVRDADAPIVQTRVSLGLGRYAVLSVRDTGHGMNAATQERIFEPFFTTKGPGQGTGLGLATVHGIMKSHAGEISVDSHPGTGTIFHLYFPALEVAAANVEVVPAPVRRGNGQRILFVDDESGLVAWGTRALQSLGYCVTGEQSVVDALAAVTDHPEAFDLVITDLTMPSMTGIEFAQGVWVVRPDLPVILTTGFSALTVEDVRRLGIGALVLKPNTIKTLGEAVQRVLEQTEA